MNGDQRPRETDRHDDIVFEKWVHGGSSPFTKVTARPASLFHHPSAPNPRRVPDDSGVEGRIKPLCGCDRGS
jgi:hypothetical protein